MHRVTVRVAVYGHGANAHLPSPSNHSHRDLPAIGNENLLDHDEQTIMPSLSHSEERMTRTRATTRRRWLRQPSRTPTAARHGPRPTHIQPDRTSFRQ